MAEWINYDDGVQIRVDDDGSMRFLLHGVLHREDGPAIMQGGPTGGYAELTGGWDELYWYRAGKIHREDGPAVIQSDGTKQWFCEGKPHRLDGPAVERADGSKEHWLFGEYLEGGAAELARRWPPGLLLSSLKKDLADIFRIAAERGEQSPGPGGSTKYALADISTLEADEFRLICAGDGAVTEWKDWQGVFFREFEPRQVGEIAQRLRGVARPKPG